MSRFLVTFLTRSGCHLCAEARPVVEAEARRFGSDVVVVDIDSDDELVRQFGIRIPVVLAPDGEVIAEGVITRRALRQALRRGRRR